MREQFVWGISPPRRPFSCGENGIPVLKEISFLLQRWECGERGKRGFGRLFSSGWKPRLRAKSVCPFGILPFVGLTHQRKPTARQPVAGGKVSRKPVFFFHPASLRGREIRVFPSVPCLAPVGEILTGPDLSLGKRHSGYSAAFFSDSRKRWLERSLIQMGQRIFPLIGTVEKVFFFFFVILCEKIHS